MYPYHGEVLAVPRLPGALVGVVLRTDPEVPDAVELADVAGLRLPGEEHAAGGSVEAGGVGNGHVPEHGQQRQHRPDEALHALSHSRTLEKQRIFALSHTRSFTYTP